MNDLYPQTHLSSESHINRIVRLTNWWHQCLDGRESEQAPGAGDGQGGLGCCSPRGCRVRYDWATELNWQADPGREHLHTEARPLVLRCCSTKPHPHISMSPSVWGFKLRRYIWQGGPNQNKEALKTSRTPENPSWRQKQAGLRNKAERRNNS